MSKIISFEEVSKHNTKEDLWMVIDKKVYDVTSFADDHPGGAEYLIENAGKDATNEFLDVGHTQKAVDMLKDYYIGDCPDSKPSNTSVPQPIAQPSSQPSSSSSSSSSDKKSNDDTKVIVSSIVVGVAAIAAVTFGLVSFFKKN